MKGKEALETLCNFFNQEEKYTKENANELWKTFGDSEDYYATRIDCYSVGDKFKFKGLKYKVIDIDRINKLITYKRLGFTFRRAPSGKRLKRFAKFGLSSQFDLTLEFI